MGMMTRKFRRKASPLALGTLCNRAVRLILCGVVCLAVQFSSAWADEGTGEWVRTENAILRLVSAWDAVGPDGQVLIGVQVPID